MDTSNHYNMRTLFEQLGLSSNPDDIDAFMDAHKLEQSERIEDAAFWSPSQASFIREAIVQDAEWAELVDHLDAELRQ